MSLKKVDPSFAKETASSKSAVSKEELEQYYKKLRRRIEDRIRKDKEALYLVARVLNIK